jgi:hypothetical protein
VNLAKLIARGKVPSYAEYKRFVRDPKHRRHTDWWFARITKLFMARDYERLIPILERAEAPNPPPAIYWAARARGGAFTSDGFRWLVDISGYRMDFTYFTP